MMTNETSPVLRWLVIVILTTATVGMFVISMRANYLYGRGIGQTPESKEAIAWANVGADLWKGFGLIVVAVLWRSGRQRAATATALTWAVCLFFSVSSAIGIYVQERTALTGGRQAKHASYHDAVKELADTEAKMKGLGRQRTPAQVEAAIAVVAARPVMAGERVRGTVGTISANCTKGDARTADACAEIAKLREELATATEAAKLEARAAALRQEIGKLRDAGGAQAADPVGEFWAWFTRGVVTVTSVGFGLPLVFALMIEMVSAFGPLAIAAYAEATRRQPTGTVKPDNATAARERGHTTHQEGRVIEFMADRTAPTASPSGITIDELYAGYADWCAGKGVRALGREAFATELDAMREWPDVGGTIQKIGGRYHGLRLIGGKIARLPTRTCDRN